MASKVTLLFVTLCVVVAIAYASSSSEEHGTFNDPRLRTSPTTASSETNKAPKTDDVQKRPVRAATQKHDSDEVTTEKRNKRSEEYDTSEEDRRIDSQTTKPRSRRDTTTSRSNEHGYEHPQYLGKNNNQQTTESSNGRKVREATSTTAKPNNGNFASPLLLRTNDRQQNGNQQTTSTTKKP